jgi:hypothetical protein
VSRTFDQIRALIARGELRISLHGYDELAADGIRARDVITGAQRGIVVEEYPEYAKGPCVLVLEHGRMVGRFMRCGAFLRARTPLRC